ncbi:MAG: hypothetical protein MK137_10125 [Rickettsiales bacterium]|nr:hypothetical protein [Rickettsiales bacterium]
MVLFFVLSLMFLALASSTLYAANSNASADVTPAKETTAQQPNLSIRVAPSENYRFKPVEKSPAGLDITPPIPQPVIPKTDPIPDLALAPGQEEPFGLEPEPAFIGNIYQVALLEDGRRVIIETDTNLMTQAYVSEEGKRTQFIPNGHYDLHKGVMVRLPQGQYTLTDDTSILLSIYKGEVINYVPRWGVEMGKFVAYDLVSAQ